MGHTVLTIGRLDPTGRSGILKDVKTLTALGGDVRAVASFCVAPLEDEKHAIFPLSTDLLWDQMQACLDDQIACIKVGSLIGSDMMDKVADFIEGPARGIPLVLEPVMTLGRKAAQVLDHDAIQAFERRLFLHATILCPNLTEAYRITGRRVVDLETMKEIADMLMTLGNRAVLLTGGSLGGDDIYDVLADEDCQEVFSSHRMAISAATAGTGDALTAAIAFGLAQGHTLRQSVIEARQCVQEIFRKASPPHVLSESSESPALY